ncbi:hypothetical protein K438DRAFT_1885618 [Mycena galopus ATCC 62051]|nr:hypothetical protein K438DRAFT_1885618 [Mycena galopus ATCC 62051]
MGLIIFPNAFSGLIGAGMGGFRMVRLVLNFFYFNRWVRDCRSRRRRWTRRRVIYPLLAKPLAATSGCWRPTLPGDDQRVTLRWL